MSDPQSEPKSKPKSNLVGKLVGGLIFVAAVASVFLIDWSKEVVEEPPVVRPIKTMVIESSFAAKGKTFPGKVGAGQQVDLAFKVPGTILQKPIRKGDKVDEGELLMRLDERDFQNEYKAAIAERDRAEAQFARVKKASVSGAVSKQEVDNAQSVFDQAEATVGIKKKALEDTSLSAPFTGVIGDTFVKQFQAVQAKQTVLSLIDLATIEIDVSVPESDAARAKPENRDKIKAIATFDFFPGEKFPVTIKEVATEADPTTQTYTVTVEMNRPEGKNILPGMTATVKLTASPDLLGGDAEGFPVPADALPIDGLGQYYAWKLEKTESGTYTVHRVDVEVGEISGNEIVVRKGLAKGDRIALAGVNILTEGREVRLLEPARDATNDQPGETAAR